MYTNILLRKAEEKI